MTKPQIKKVLLVDDVEFITDVMAGYLRRSPVEAVTASNGKLAIDQALLHWPDLIIMDVSMPEMGGEEACREIKKHPKLKASLRFRSFLSAIDLAAAERTSTSVSSIS